ncbi:MAG: cell division protein SepF [Candidatus Diapherotrites archaeon]
MGFFEKVVGKKDELDIEEFLNNLDVEEEAMYEDADAYVKPLSLQTDADKDLVIEELKKGNVILLNIADLSKRNQMKLRELINQIKGTVHDINGDIARISQERVIITPQRVKIIKSRPNA